MKLSTRGRYAVMAMTELALQSQGRPVILADIAQGQEISLSYLEQLFGKLRRNNLVQSVRGPGGGYRLSRPANEIFVAEIIRAVDEPITTTGCDQKRGRTTGCRKNNTRCVTHNLWQELGQRIETYLSSVSLADVCASGAEGDHRESVHNDTRRTA